MDISGYYSRNSAQSAKNIKKQNHAILYKMLYSKYGLTARINERGNVPPFAHNPIQIQDLIYTAQINPAFRILVSTDDEDGLYGSLPIEIRNNPEPDSYAVSGKAIRKLQLEEQEEFKGVDLSNVNLNTLQQILRYAYEKIGFSGLKEFMRDDEPKSLRQQLGQEEPRASM